MRTWCATVLLLLSACNSDNDVAYDPHATTEELLEVLNSDNGTLRQEAARHPNLDEAGMLIAAASKDVQVRHALLERQHLPGSVLSALAHDPYADLRTRIAALSDTVFLSGTDGSWRAFPALLSEMAADGNAGVAARVAGNPLTPAGTLVALATRQLPAVDVQLAQNPNIPDTVARTLLRRADSSVMLLLAGNPALNVDAKLALLERAGGAPQADSLLPRLKELMGGVPFMRIGLEEAMQRGLVSVAVTGSGLTSVTMELTSEVEFGLEIDVEHGTLFNSRSGGVQNMVVRVGDAVVVRPEASVTVSLEASCVQMHKAVPDDGDGFTIQRIAGGSDLQKLLDLEGFKQHQLRVQQFAIWTITDNPSRGGYVGLGTGYSGSGPSDEEFVVIRDLFVAAGIDPQDYRAFARR